ncbi:class I SAM-dependent RNA methyltransferase [Jannaschia aquimarina]|uniref:RlmD protein n=1 Tax=Jannaschia aquimarina TaxID=935700 RepID=A0A0D1EH60_9RHOB|nr:class I SAM-dependent RNA methyltransferase [Jannaschia aquimarina]KIT17009.1 23S rRNA (uracil(1939)-C(5))-methyltransferase RlmD [Jannaschia aquimarina]SNS81382.1 23S rRNA m(5)U-1939 methyltransferase [Jannaschia aquimarina]
MTQSHLIDRLGHRGDGIAPGPIYVPRTLPGEEVTGDIVGDRVPEPRIVTPSPDRVAPPCPHFRRCGGCVLQHASDGFVAEWKRSRVADALSRAGVKAQIGPVHTSPPNSRRRAALKGRKTKKGAQVGFHAAGSHDLVAIPDCRLLSRRLMGALPALEVLTRRTAPRGAEIGLHLTETATGLDLSITGGRPLDAGMVADLPFARVTQDGEPIAQTVAPEVQLGPARVVPPPGAFLQATAEGEATLVAAIAPAFGGARRIADLFAGMGTFTFPAAQVAPTDAFEGAADLVEALNGGIRHAPGCKAITTTRRDLFREPLTVEELSDYDMVILDPPRAGAAAQIAHLAEVDIAAIAYVSCDPDSFARDAANLVAGGWRPGPVTLVDQFRWSAHLELAAIFRRETP